MMRREPIKNFNREIIGWLETDASGNQLAKDFYNILLGRYNAKTNITTNFYGQVVGVGNHLLGLIYESDRAYKEKKTKSKIR